ncbi:hypothetical protein LINPERHAP2_LOCUS41886, partial [Linum perenne]
HHSSPRLIEFALYTSKKRDRSSYLHLKKDRVRFPEGKIEFISPQSCSPSSEEIERDPGFLSWSPILSLVVSTEKFHIMKISPYPWHLNNFYQPQQFQILSLGQEATTIWDFFQRAEVYGRAKGSSYPSPRLFTGAR